MATTVGLAWSDDALADLNRFAEFLHDQSPELASIVAEEIFARAQLHDQHPRLGRSIAGREEYQQIVLQVLGAPYAFQHRHDPARAVILRIVHGREARR